MKLIRTSGLVVVQHQKLLLVYSGHKKAWYLPGGKIEPNETSIAALMRECKEELTIDLNPEKLHFFTTIRANAFGENDCEMIQDCFCYTLDQALHPGAEIEAVDFFDYETYCNEPHQVEGVLKIFAMLKLIG